MWQEQKWQVCHALMLLPHSEVLQIKQPTIVRPTQPRTSETAKRNKSAGSRNLCSQDSKTKLRFLEIAKITKSNRDKPHFCTLCNQLI